MDLLSFKHNFSIIQNDLNVERPRMTIKCVASIYTAYYKTVEVTVGLRRRSKLRRRQHGERGDLTSTQGPDTGTDHQRGQSHLLIYRVL